MMKTGKEWKKLPCQCDFTRFLSIYLSLSPHCSRGVYDRSCLKQQRLEQTCCTWDISRVLHGGVAEWTNDDEWTLRNVVATLSRKGVLCDNVCLQFWVFSNSGKLSKCSGRRKNPAFTKQSTSGRQRLGTEDLNL